MSDRRQVGIPVAVDATGRQHGRDAIDAVPQPFVKPLQCAGCGIPVDVVTGYVAGGRRRTSSHYRRHRGTQHEPNCPFDFDRQVQTIAAADATALDRERGGRYRLLLPDELSNPQPTKRIRERPRHRSPMLVVRSATPTLPAAINSAAKVARLLDRFDDMPEAVDRFIVQAGYQRIRWPDFCYHPARYPQLAERLTSDSELPVAVIGTVDRHGQSQAGTSHFISHDPNIRAAINGQMAYLRLQIWSPDPRILARVADADRFIALGRCRLRPARASTGGHHRSILTMWINHRAAITTW